jgi:hypothetical protein
MNRATALAFALAACAACTAPRTEILVRVETDMAQGPASALTAIAIRVTSADETMPRFDQRIDLGVGASPVLLPSTLGVVPRDAAANRQIEVEVDALGGDTVLFTRRVIATFAQGRTLVLDVFLADRCRRPENQMCPDGFTCGATGCEPVERMMLPELGDDAGASDGSTAADAGIDSAIDAGCPDVCGGSCVDVDSDPLHCGSCTACPPVTNGTALCESGVCGSSCDAGFLAIGGTCTALTAPRPIAPISMGRTSHRSPTLRWDLPPGADGAHVEICADAACAMVESAFDATGTSGTVPIRLSTAPTVVHYFRLFARTGTTTGTTPSATWSFVIPFADGTSSTSWPALFDAELDGYGEVAVGEPSVGAVSVFRGAAAGQTTTASPRLVGPASSLFGSSVAHGGDVDGDGFGDLVVGAPGASAAFVYLGSSTGLSSTGTRIDGPASSGFGASVASAGDVDGDGFGDLIVGAPEDASAFVFRGSHDGIHTHASVVLTGAPASRFGAAVASAGDVDGDGFGDVVVGAPGGDAAFVYRGSATGIDLASVVALAGAAGSGFGSAVAGGGDTALLDGLSDVAIGAPMTSTVQIFAGAASGLEATPDFTLTETSPELGISLAFGDLDLNGYDDVVVGSGGEIVYVYLSNSSGPGMRAGWNQSISAPAGVMGFGHAVGVNETNRDQYLDVVVGAPGSSAAYWCGGRASGALTADVPLAGTAGSDFGVVVACLAPAWAGSNDG